ncbi:DUF3631 domain-containing protein [Embleya sp. NPDC005575]|uniref:DUF3631 domain-containing protein n=1 Tax=Embleya sp. NPDC005575 TaxID=3156892 RepID=UPI0033BEFA86
MKPTPTDSTGASPDSPAAAPASGPELARAALRAQRPASAPAQPVPGQAPGAAPWQATPTAPPEATFRAATTGSGMPDMPAPHTGFDLGHDAPDTNPPAGVDDGTGDSSPHTHAAPEGAALLDELRCAVGRYVVLPHEHALDAVVLWITATHLQPAWQHAPRLAVVGPAKRCGKSRLLDVLTETVHEPFITINATIAAVFRSIGTEEPPTLLVDEADTLFGTAKAAERNEELRGLLNASHQRNRPATRVSGPEHKPVQFATFAMAALAGIGDLPDTIMDRSIVVRMRRRAPGERVQPFRSRRDTPLLHELRDRIAAWLAPCTNDAAGMEPVMPVEDRAADTWEPLVAVAELAGGAWPERARAACTAMTAYEAGNDDEGGPRIRILADIRKVFAAGGDPTALSTEHLLTALRTDPDGPWAEWGNGGLTARAVQVLLKDYGITSATIRFAPDGIQRKGFHRAAFTDAWERYCPAGPAAEHGPDANTGDHTAA